MKKVAIYARYSTDLQSARSIEDQIRVCNQRAHREGWSIYQRYTDHAISAATMKRAGLQEMLKDARDGKLDIILVESLDRLSRDQADIAAIFKHMQFAGVEIITLCEGRVGILDVGLRGTMNQLYLVEVANKARRGQEGRVKAGKVASGLSYGYDVVRRFDTSGFAVKGERKINTRQAKIIRRIFRDYAAGHSPRKIAKCLNEEGVPSPFGKEWNPGTIHGNRHRGIGIVNNEFYIGQLVWNRMTFITDPDTGRRVYRLNPESAWVRQPVPWLRIVTQGLWDKVKQRQQKVFTAKAAAALRMAKVHYRRHFPKYLLSGLLTCGSCGGGFGIRRHDRYGCFARDHRGTCANALRIGRKALEGKVFGALKQHLANDPERCAAFCEAYARRLIEVRTEHNALIQSYHDELGRIEEGYDRITDTPNREYSKSELGAQIKRAIARHRVFTRLLVRAVDTVEPMETHYREHVVGLVDALNRSRHHKDSFHALRSVIGQIALRPNEDGTELLVDVGDGPRKRQHKPKMVREPPAKISTPDIASRATYFGLHSQMQERGKGRALGA